MQPVLDHALKHLPALLLLATLAAGRSDAAPADTLALRRGFWLPAGREGAWPRDDHLRHLGLSFTLGLGAGLGAREPEAALAALVLGAAKEVADSRRHGASRRDLVADALGAALAAAAVAALLESP